MKEYPAEITPELLKKYEHITDREVARDIAETEAEVIGLQRTMKAEEELAEAHPNPLERRMADFRAGGRPYQIEQRERFIAFLRRLQEARRAHCGHCLECDRWTPFNEIESHVDQHKATGVPA
jgi:hypothetical protein